METKTLKPYFVVLGLMILTSLALAFTVDVNVTDQAGIRMVLARPALYVRYHHLLVELVNRHIPVAHVGSIDEMAMYSASFECAPKPAKPKRSMTGPFAFSEANAASVPPPSAMLLTVSSRPISR